MAQAPPALRDIARSVLRHEARGSTNPEALAGALGHALKKVQDELSNLVGRRGVAALVGRSVNLARRDFAILESVVPDAESPEVLIGLAESLRARPPNEAEAACEAVLVQLLGLLVGFLGDDLGCAR